MDLENEAYDNMVNAINKFKPGKVKGGLIQFDEGEDNTVPRRKRSQSFVAEQINRSQESSKSDDNNESMSASGAKFGIDNLPKRPYKEIKMLKNRQQIKKNDVSRQQLYLKKVNIHESNTVEGQLPKMHMLGKNKPEKASEIQREDAMMLLQDAQTMYKTDHKTVSKDNQESENNFTTVQQSNIEELSILQNEEVKVAVNSQGIAVVVHKHLTPLPVPISRKTSR